MDANEIRALRQVYRDGLNPPINDSTKDSVTFATIAVTLIEMAAQMAEKNELLCELIELQRESLELHKASNRLQHEICSPLLKEVK